MIKGFSRYSCGNPDQPYDKDHNNAYYLRKSKPKYNKKDLVEWKPEPPKPQ
jgi:hypothetical protein